MKTRDVWFLVTFFVQFFALMFVFVVWVLTANQALMNIVIGLWASTLVSALSFVYIDYLFKRSIITAAIPVPEGDSDDDDLTVLAWFGAMAALGSPNSSGSSDC